MKRGVFLSVVIALLAGCKETPPPAPDGYYVIDDITVTYDNPADNAPENSDPEKNVKAAIRDTMVSLKDSTFFWFERAESRWITAATVLTVIFMAIPLI